MAVEPTETYRDVMGPGPQHATAEQARKRGFPGSTPSG